MMMNLAHPAHHRGLGVGVTAANALGMGIGPYSSTAPSLHQRSPFAIQELLGLNPGPSPGSGGGDSGGRVPTAAHHHPGHHPAHHHHPSAGDAGGLLSASSYIPRTMGGAATLGVAAACHTSQAACLGDPASVASHHPTFPSWRPNFMPFSTMSTMSTMSTGSHPHQTMLNLGGSQAVMHPSPGDSATGKAIPTRVSLKFIVVNTKKTL